MVLELFTERCGWPAFGTMRMLTLFPLLLRYKLDTARISMIPTTGGIKATRTRSAVPETIDVLVKYPEYLYLGHTPTEV